MTTRGDAIRSIHDGRATWQALLDDVGEDRMEQPGPMGQWTMKDLAAHLLGWRNLTLTRLEAGPSSDPPAPWPPNKTTDDEINAWIYEQNRDRPLAEVLADFDRSFDRLADVIEAVSDDDLKTRGRYPWLGGAALIDVDFTSHLYEEHEPSIREWLTSQSA